MMMDFGRKMSLPEMEKEELQVFDLDRPCGREAPGVVKGRRDSALLQESSSKPESSSGGIEATAALAGSTLLGRGNSSLSSRRVCRNFKTLIASSSFNSLCNGSRLPSMPSIFRAGCLLSPPKS